MAYMVTEGIYRSYCPFYYQFDNKSILEGTFPPYLKETILTQFTEEIRSRSRALE